jgi:hypothetical protein
VSNDQIRTVTPIVAPIIAPIVAPIVAPIAAPVITPNGLKVLTYNVYFVAMADAIRRKNITDFINFVGSGKDPQGAGHGLDFICIQEAANVEAIADVLTTSMQGIITTSGKENIATYYDSSKYKPIYSIVGEFESGRPFQINIYSINDNTYVTVINLHAGHGYNVARIETAIDTKIATSTWTDTIRNSRIIVMGDFNLDVTSMKVLGVLVSYSPNALSQRKQTCCNTAGYNSHHTQYYDNILDSMQTESVAVGNPEEPASDHLPVIGYLYPINIKVADNMPQQSQTIDQYLASHPPASQERYPNGLIKDVFLTLPISNQKFGAAWTRTPDANITEAQLITIPEFKQILDVNRSRLSNAQPFGNGIPSALLPLPKSVNLQNLGNSCYFNATLQLLFAINEVRSASTYSLGTNSDFNDVGRIISLMFANPSDIPHELLNANLSAVLRQALMSCTRILKVNPGTQQDAMELFLKLINLLMEQKFVNTAEYKRMFTVTIDTNYYYAGNPDILLGSNSEDSIQFTLQLLGAQDIVTALNKYFYDVEIIDGFNVRFNVRQDKVFAFQQKRISAIPMYLIIEPVTNSTDINNRLPINKYISYRQSNYIVLGMILFTGGINGGHYATYRYGRYVSAQRQHIYYLYDDASRNIEPGEKVETLTDMHLNNSNYSGYTPKLIVYGLSMAIR